MSLETETRRSYITCLKGLDPMQQELAAWAWNYLAPTPPFILLTPLAGAEGIAGGGILGVGPPVSVPGLVQSSSISSIARFRLSPKMTLVPIDPLSMLSWETSGIEPVDRNCLKESQPRDSP